MGGKTAQKAENASTWQANFIKLHCAVCDNSSTIGAVIQRQSDNFCPQFSDGECTTVYLWGVSPRRFEQKAICNTKNHLLDRFPKLPGYAAFSRRLNALAPAFQVLAELWLNSAADGACEEAAYIAASCPAILAKGPRSSSGLLLHLFDRLAALSSFLFNS